MRNRGLGFVLAFALALRVALLAAGWSHPDRLMTPDSRHYIALAEGLLDGRFGQPGRPEVFRTPGYPAFLAVVFGLGGGARSAAAVQVLLDVGLVGLTYLLGRRLAGERTGAIAAGVQAVSPVALAASVRVLSDGLFAAMLAAALLLTARAMDGRRARSALAAGGLMAAACLVRPIGLVAAAVMVGVLLARPKRWALAAAFAAPVLIAVGGWTLRNSAAGYDRPAGVADYNLYYYSAAALAEADPSLELPPHPNYPPLAAADAPADTPARDHLNDPDFLLRCRREGLAVLARRPGRYALVHARTSLHALLPAATDVLEVAGATTGGRGTLGTLRRRGLLPAVQGYFGDRWWALALAAPMVLILAGKYLAAIVAAVRAPWRRLDAAAWMMLLTAAALLLAAGPAAHARFRVPVAPLISVAAAAGLAAIRKKQFTADNAEGAKEEAGLGREKEAV
jgi:4-amino-4-deoxy-L-arabinose transferase-like glycosyltransferase